MESSHPPSTGASVKTHILPPTPDGLAQAASALMAGEVVGIPTETVYGLAGDAFQTEALAKIFEAKGRPTRDPLILHVPVPEVGIAAGWPDGASARLVAWGVVDGDRLTDASRAVVDQLARQFWPGPLTLILPRGPRVPMLATSGLDTVAVRAPSHPVTQALLRAVRVPLAAPSANRFGRISPTTAAHVLDELGGRIPLILDGGAATVGVESTVIQVKPDGTLSCLRPGGIPQEALLSDGATASPPPSSYDLGGALPSPGMMESHYAPAHPLYLLPAPVASLSTEVLRGAIEGGQATHRGDGGVGLLLQGGPNWEEAKARVARALAIAPEAGHIAACIILAPEGEAQEAARHLFGALRTLDQSAAVAWILAEPPKEAGGLWTAIRDRLQRAAAPRSHGGSKPE